VRLFQNAGVYPAYLHRLDALRERSWTFERQRTVVLEDGFGAPHVLLPVLLGDANAFYTNSDDPVMQRQWAREHGMASNAPLTEILLAQLEEHRTELFYNMDPMRYQADFIRRLPGCVRSSVAWRAAPSPGADFSAYDLVVCNFPSILRRYTQMGWRAAYFSPAHHPALDSFGANSERLTDILFVGGYSRHHRRRGELLEVVAKLQHKYRILFHIDQSRLTRFAESAVGRLLPLGRHRRPKFIRAISRPPVFGAQLYSAMSRAKIVLNGAIDMAGEDRGNLRCFEAMGCGALMVSDRGVYPKGMVDGMTILTYSSPHDCINVIEAILKTPIRMLEVAANGLELMKVAYSKRIQWQEFIRLVEAL
jgi:hypothetical protein